jgi:hypothetical protein
MAPAIMTSEARISLRRPNLSAIGAISRPPAAMPASPALKTTPSRSGVTCQSVDRAGAI